MNTDLFASYDHHGKRRQPAAAAPQALHAEPPRVRTLLTSGVFSALKASTRKCWCVLPERSPLPGPRTRSKCEQGARKANFGTV